MKIIPENLQFEPRVVFYTLKMMKNISFPFDEEYINSLPIKVKNNEKIIKQILEINGIYLKYLTKKVRANNEFVKKEVDNYPKAINYASFKIRVLRFNS